MRTLTILLAIAFAGCATDGEREFTCEPICANNNDGSLNTGFPSFDFGTKDKAHAVADCKALSGTMTNEELCGTAATYTQDCQCTEKSP
jgi:hypothetical protein